MSQVASLLMQLGLLDTPLRKTCSRTPWILSFYHQVLYPRRHTNFETSFMSKGYLISKLALAATLDATLDVRYFLMQTCTLAS